MAGTPQSEAINKVFPSWARKSPTQCRVGKGWGCVLSLSAVIVVVMVAMMSVMIVTWMILPNSHSNLG
jgi:hypothetical protein